MPRFVVKDDGRRRDVIVTRAFLRAVENLGLSSGGVRRVLGVSEASVSRLRSLDKRSQRKVIDLGKKEGEMALYVLRIYRSLDSLFGGNLENCRRWFHSHNIHLNGVPAELVQNIEGIVDVARYLDAMRGKV